MANPDSLLEQVRQMTTNGPELVRTVTTEKVYHLPGQGPKVVVMDFGIKQNILRMLQEYGWDVTVVPSYTSAKEIMALAPGVYSYQMAPEIPRTCLRQWLR